MDSSDTPIFLQNSRHARNEKQKNLGPRIR